MRTSLTDLSVRSAKAPEHGTTSLWDSSVRGFGLRCSQGGTKTFFVMVGKERSRIRIGHYPEWSLKDARTEAIRILAARATGKARPKRMSFQEAFSLFKETHTRPKNRQRTAAETERLIEKHFIPRLGRRDLNDISTQDVAQLIDKLLLTPSTALHAHAATRLMFRWAAKRQLIDRSPLEYLDPPTKIAARDRTLTDGELRLVYQAAHEGSMFSDIVRLLIITGQRRGQISALRREFVDEEARLITWPAELMKGNRRHSIPLTATAAAVLSTLPKEGYLFPARGKDTSFNGFSKCKAAFDTRVDIAPWTLHDLRRTFSTGIAKLRVAPHIKEMLLAHSTAKDPVEAIYDLHTYEEEMREAMQKWEDHLQTLLPNTESMNANLPGPHYERARAAE